MSVDYMYDKNALRKLMVAYLAAKAYYETIHEKEAECEKRVLESQPFYEDEKWAEMLAGRGETYAIKRILDPEDSYMMDEQDSQEYYTLIYEEYKKEGIAHPNGRTWIPSSIARDELRKCENAIIDYGVSIVPDELKETIKYAKRHWKYRDKLLDIILRLDCGKIGMDDFKKEGYI